MNKSQLPVQIGGCPLSIFGMACFAVAAFNLIGFVMLPASAMDSGLGWVALIAGVIAFAGVAVLSRREESGN